MAFLIDPPEPFAARRQWEEFLVRLKSLPQDDPGVQAEIRNAERTLAQATLREPNDVEGGRQQVRQLIKQALAWIIHEAPRVAV
jgi:acyl-ACP thioesterase